MYPHILLKIENYIPHLYYVKNENEQTRITLVDEDLSKIIVDSAKEIGLGHITDINELFALANEADDMYIDENPVISIDSVEFELKEAAKVLVNLCLQMDEEYANVDVSEEIRKELKRNQQLDMLASMINVLYKVMIAKTLSAAHDLEIDKIHFTGDYNFARFTERLGKELDNLGVELFVD